MSNKNAAFMRKIYEMIDAMQSLVKEAVLEIEPQVDEIICRHVMDKLQIETLLDKLLDYAGIDDTGLALFKRLCRHYFPINPKSTTDYIYAYRDLYDSEANDE